MKYLVDLTYSERTWKITGHVEQMSEYSAKPAQDFYHPDPPIFIGIGSSAFITYADGNAHQYLQYLPFGEDFVFQKLAWQTRYTFSAKEKDEATGYHFPIAIGIGARYYDSDVSVWLSVDPMAFKYPDQSPYSYVGNRPINTIDPWGLDEYKDPNGNTGNSGEGYKQTKDKKYLYGDGVQTKVWDPDYTVEDVGGGQADPYSKGGYVDYEGDPVDFESYGDNGSIDNKGFNDKYANILEGLSGKPYVYGADGPNSFDCSGAACFGIRNTANPQFGDYTAHDLFEKYTFHTKSKERGNVLFYDYTSDGRIDHITTILNTKKMLHPSSGAKMLQIKPISYLNNYTYKRKGKIYLRRFNWKKIRNKK